MKINTMLAIATKLVFILLAIFADVGVTVLVILNSLRRLKFE